MNVSQQNDWAEFRSHLYGEMDRQVTSNKAVLWTAITVLSLSILLCAVLIVKLMIQVTTLENRICVSNSKITQLQIDIGTMSRAIDCVRNGR